MKKNKHFAVYVFLIGILLSSCTRDDILESENVQKQSCEFKLISKRMISENEALALKGNLKSILYTSAYESSTPIYSYITFHGATRDHFYTTENVPDLMHDGFKYSVPNQLFNLPKGSRATVPLYIHYNNQFKDHVLSTSNFVPSYVGEGELGFIYTDHEVGTVPLKEYYSSQRNSHLYIMSNAEEEFVITYERYYVFQKIVGYVYPGQFVDVKKNATEFIIADHGFSFSFYPSKIILTIKVREGDTFWELLYSAEMLVQEPLTFILNNTYTVVAADITFISDYWVANNENTYTDITDPSFVSEDRHVSGECYHSCFKRIDGYKVEYGFWHVFATGIE